jgi:hypothetical protein
MLIKLFLGAPITFILMYVGKYLVSDKNVPQEFPFIMFEVVVFFGLVYPIIAALIVLLCERSARLKKWSIGIGMALSLAVTIYVWVDIPDLEYDRYFYLFILSLFGYCALTISGLISFVARISLQLRSFYVAVALRLRGLFKAAY